MKISTETADTDLMRIQWRINSVGFCGWFKCFNASNDELSLDKRLLPVHFMSHPEARVNGCICGWVSHRKKLCVYWAVCYFLVPYRLKNRATNKKSLFVNTTQVYCNKLTNIKVCLIFLCLLIALEV